ncbi:MAG: universal stress protein [Bacteroidota bacterium]
MKKILVPTDFSNTACFAHEFAKTMAKVFDAEIFAVHAYTIPYLEATVPTEIRQEIMNQQKKSVEKQFRDFFYDHPNQKSTEDIAVRVVERYTICEGNPIDVIIRESKKEDIDLIVMGTRGAHNLGEKIFGSVTTAVIENVDVPVVVIPEGATFHGMKNIAYATNYEEGDENFIEFLEIFSKKMDAMTHFLHIDNSPKNTLKSSGSKVPETKIQFDMGFVSFTELAGDSIIDSIDHFVENENIDLLAIFIPNRGFWKNLFHKRLSKQMVFHSKIPLLFYHA